MDDERRFKDGWTSWLVFCSCHLKQMDRKPLLCPFPLNIAHGALYFCVYRTKVFTDFHCTYMKTWGVWEDSLENPGCWRFLRGHTKYTIILAFQGYLSIEKCFTKGSVGWITCSADALSLRYHIFVFCLHLLANESSPHSGPVNLSLLFKKLDNAQ